MEWLRAIADLCAWAGCLTACFMLGKLAWKVRGRAPFKATAFGLALVCVTFGVERALELLELRPQLLPASEELERWSTFGSVVVAGSIVLLLPFLRRVTDFKLTPEAAQQKFLTAAEVNNEAFCILETVRTLLRTTDFRFTFGNSSALKLFQLTEGELLGRELTKLLPHVHESGLLERLKEVVQTGGPYSGDVKDTTPEGVSVSFNLRAVKTHGGVAVVLHDLTEERARRKHLEELNKFSASIIQDAPFSIIATNPTGTITAMNMAAEQLTGYRRHELVGTHSLVMLHDPTELSSRATQLGESLGEPVVAGFETLTASLKRRKNTESEWNYVRKDGQRVAVHLAMTVLRGPDDDVTGYLAVAFDISERKKLNDSISFLAHHDSLTKMPNRMLLNERLRQAIERAKTMDQQVAVFMVDIDQFKRINDSLGHWAGDQLLIEVSERLLSAVRKTDTVARVGGDEFIVLMPNSGTVETAHICASRILAKLQPPVVIAGREVNVTASVGLCIYPDWAGDPVSLLRNADAAMYAAKARGRNHFQTFSGSLLEASTDKLEMEADLRNAVKNAQMYVAYQPQVDCKTGEIVGTEALLRWKHPTRGLVPPSEFIPIAEESGLILPIGQWALRQACVETKRMQQATGKKLSLASNLSPRQFQQKDLSEVVESALAEAGLGAEDLELEITESTLMVSSTDTLAGLRRLRDRGVRIAIDDFGTGFSNFQYILDYKADRLKIDRSFVMKCPDDPTANSVVRTIIAMAHGLGMKVVAEGVETEEQLSFLLRRRCDEAQGFYLARPTRVDELIEMVRNWKPVVAPLRTRGNQYPRLLSAQPEMQELVSKPM